jgi:uncharacterized protein
MWHRDSVQIETQIPVFACGKFIVLAWIGPWFYLPGAVSLFEFLNLGADWPTWSVFSVYYAHFITAAVVVLVVVVWEVPWNIIFGRTPTLDQILPALNITVYLWVFSVAAAYVLFIPLSFAVPSFVQWWYLDIPSPIYFDKNQYPITQNVLGFVSLVLVVPVVEELMFRGILLRRWAQKWNIHKAIIFSSLVFGLLHSDPIGAFAFGVGMCILYLQTQSLLVPILCHAFHNFMVFLIEVGFVYLNGPNYEYTLEKLRSEWAVGVIFVIFSVAWGHKLFAAGLRSDEWKLPTS